MKTITSFAVYGLVILTLLFYTSVSAVHADNDPYLFDDFKSALLISGNKQYQADVNYSFKLNAFVFKDINDNCELKLIDPVMEIRTIRTEDRIFLIDDKRVTKEVLQDFPFIAVQYKGRMKSEGKNAGYGGTSETAAINSYARYYDTSSGHFIELQTGKIILSGISKIYEIDRNGKLKSFRGLSNFIKLYPKGIQSEIRRFINEKNIDFSDPEQVITLYNFSEKLVIHE